ncbi:Structural maintenance of chromosomes protein 6 [Eumeta japonica]|uniref:Structural maintenance of chromosomes protein 6 n=1 Tax=Eumeta variegata TaxID=151549 RepID=A0A4C1WUU4_EUMVA|nr:Structural maintenance of chromosomes protein 6 [Eumeta japonica]
MQPTISSGDQWERTTHTRPRRVTLNDRMNALRPFSARRELQRNALAAVRFRKEGSAIPPDPLHAVIDNVFDIGRFQDFPKRNVNFIVGRNGSGKSAILTALVVGLGGRATATNRGSSLTWEVISTKFEEVNAITLAHDIQVDNPISVLNQDDARSFHASDAKKKYSLFRRATNLDQTETNYLRALENCEKAKATCQRKKEAFSELEKELKKWQQSYEQLQSRDEIAARKERLQNELYWSEIAEFEYEAEQLQVQYNRQKTRIDTFMQKLNKMEQSVGNDNEIINTLKAKILEKNNEVASLEAELNQCENDLQESQSLWRTSLQSMNKHSELLKREKKKVVDLEREINNINPGQAATQRQQLERAAAEARDAAEATRARFDTAQNDAAQARQNSQRATATSEQYHQRLQRQKDNIRHLKIQQRELESRDGDALAVYGANMVELCRRVRSAAQKNVFSEPPRGPVGAYIKVKERKWAGPLEHIIGGSMQSFCVNSPEDSRKLFELMNSVYGNSAKPGVTCSKFLSKQHDVRKNKVRAGNYLSALDSMDVNDPVVANFLIDNIGVEKILLVPDHDDAIRLSDNVENVPVNCSKIVTLDSTEYHPAPNYRSYGGAGRSSRYLQVSTAERKRQLAAEIAEAESQLQDFISKAEDYAREAEAARVAELNASRLLQALFNERHERDAASRAADAQLDQMQAPQHSVLAEELEISKEKIIKLNQELQKLTDKENNCKKKMETYEAKIKVVKNKLNMVSQVIRNLNEEVDREQLKVDHGATERQMLSQKIQEDNKKLGQLEIVLKDKKDVVINKTKELLESCPRVENPREKSIVTRELKDAQMKLKAIRNDGLTKEQVEEKLAVTRDRYTHTKRELVKLHILIEEVKKTSDQHLEFCQRMHTYIAKRVQHCFKSILALRGYSGEMMIDNTKKVLEMVCAGREESRRAASTSSLSGGERSYCTVAFIMALWECVELPFYFMDEFDVFMDNVNRKIVMDLLLAHALQNTNRQFVFLTPQDASTISAGPTVAIHRMYFYLQDKLCRHFGVPIGPEPPGLCPGCPYGRDGTEDVIRDC